MRPLKGTGRSLRAASYTGPAGVTCDHRFLNRLNSLEDTFIHGGDLRDR